MNLHPGRGQPCPREPGRADLPVGLGARQRVPTGFMGGVSRSERNKGLSMNQAPTAAVVQRGVRSQHSTIAGVVQGSVPVNVQGSVPVKGC
jgi:hypothetical protein